MLESNLHRVRGVEGVRWAVPLYKGTARAKVSPIGAPDEKTVIEQVILLGLDDVSLVGAPHHSKVLVGSVGDLRLPDAVMVDDVRLEKLFPEERKKDHPEEGIAFYQRFLNRQFEMNDHRAVIVAVCQATPTFQTNPVVYTTYNRAKNFAPQERKILSYILAQAEPGWTKEAVADRIRSSTGLKAETSDEFAWMTIDYYMRYTGIPFNFAITALLGFLVGTAIAGQTFYNFTIENLKQFAALKAMGMTNLKIVGMIQLQALIVGILGYGIGVGLSALFGQVAGGTELAYYTWWVLLPITAGAIVLICLLASLLSVQKVIRLEPAIVFR
jgi:putative ABC transport system permease protein